MATLKVVPASQIKVGDTMYPFAESIGHIYVKSIEKKKIDDREFLIFRGDGIGREGIFKCYPNSVVSIN